VNGTTRWRRLLRRLAEAALTLWLVATLCFALLHAAPGGPFDSERAVSEAVERNLRARYHLDESLPRQYLRYLSQCLRGDLGPSFQYPDYRVHELIAAGLPVSATTGGIALLLAFVGGVAVGARAGWRAGTPTDRVAGALSALGMALPKFVIAPLLILLFAVWLGWLPAGGWDWRDPRTWLLPALALAVPNFAVFARLARAGTLEALSSDYVRAARARGIEGRGLFVHHVLKPTVLAASAYLSPALIALLTGSTVVEQAFGIPGMGRYFVQGALNRDYTLVMGVALVSGALIVMVNVLVDTLRVWLDPRLGDTPTS
jgi:oligopeptide transport system permease protein